MFVTPMFASPLPKQHNLIISPDEWWAEEKYDGIRIISEVSEKGASLFVKKGVMAWSRYGNIHELPTHIKEKMSLLPDGVYDGELLVPGLRSYGSARLENSRHLRYFIFDLISLDGNDFTVVDYASRRQTLRDIFDTCLPGGGFVELARSTRIKSWEHVLELRDEIWDRDGEGLILKRANSLYIPGKRPKTWVKIKQLQSAVLEVVRFEDSRGEKNYRGPCAMTILRDDEGNFTTVKTRNDAICRHLESLVEVGKPHPYIGRKLRIEFQERTPDGSYRHPRWDRWEDE
jgi:bifunctional non-homologous end joining protein LigD